MPTDHNYSRSGSGSQVQPEISSNTLLTPEKMATVEKRGGLRTHELVQSPPMEDLLLADEQFPSHIQLSPEPGMQEPENVGVVVNLWPNQDGGYNVLNPRTSTPCDRPPSVMPSLETTPIKEPEKNASVQSANDWCCSEQNEYTGGQADGTSNLAIDVSLGNSTLCDVSSRENKSPTISHVDKWMEEPEDLDEDTCDLVYLIPPATRSRPCQDVHQVNRNQQSARNQTVNKVIEVCEKFDSLLNSQLELINREPNRDRQIELHKSLLSNPMAQMHYAEMTNLAKTLKSQPNHESDQRHNWSDIKEPAPGPSSYRDTRNPWHSNSRNASRNSSRSDARTPREQRETLEGKYTITLISKNVMPIDTAGYFDSAVKDASLHVDNKKSVGQNLEVILRTKSDRDEALAALRRYKFLGKSVDELYTIEMDARSSHLFRTRVFSKELLNSLEFMHLGRFNPNEAIDLVQRKNKHWFHSKSDIIDVQLKPSTEPEGALLQIYTTRDAHKRVCAGIKNGLKLDLIQMQVVLHEPVKTEVCFKCHDPGHRREACQAPLKCKYCILSHEKEDCVVYKNKGPYTCFRCRAYNVSLKTGQEKLRKAEDHVATHVACPFFRELRRKRQETDKFEHSAPSKRSKYNQ